MNSNCCFFVCLFFSQLFFKVKKINSIRRISAHQVHRWSRPYDGKWSYSKWCVPWKKNQWATRDKTHFELAFAVFKTIIGIPRKQMFLVSVWYNCPSELMVIYLGCFCLFIGPVDWYWASWSAQCAIACLVAVWTVAARQAVETLRGHARSKKRNAPSAHYGHHCCCVNNNPIIRKKMSLITGGATAVKGLNLSWHGIPYAISAKRRCFW